MAAKRQDFSTRDNCEPWGYVALVRHICLIIIIVKASEARLEVSAELARLLYPQNSEMAGPSGLKLGGLVEGMCPNVLTKEFFRSVKGAWQNGRQSG